MIISGQTLNNILKPGSLLGYQEGNQKVSYNIPIRDINSADYYHYYHPTNKDLLYNI